METLSTDQIMVPLDRLFTRTRSLPSLHTPSEKLCLSILKATIRRRGVRQHLTVRALDGGFFEVVDGERRLRAALELCDTGDPAAPKELPCRPQFYANDEEALIDRLILNLHRPLTPQEVETIIGALAKRGIDPRGVALLSGIPVANLSGKTALETPAQLDGSRIDDLISWLAKSRGAVRGGTRIVHILQAVVDYSRGTITRDSAIAALQETRESVRRDDEE